MSFTAAVAGASGYAGGELIRLISGHPQLTLGPVAAGSQAGKTLGDVHPQLPGLAEVTLVETSAQALAADVLFLALPHGQSSALVEHLPADAVVIDLGADYRLGDAAAWNTYYGGAHAGTWTYGLPELPGAREQIVASHRVANPGCYVTAVTLALAPLLRARLIDPSDIVVVAASGTSGAGRAASGPLLASEVMGNTKAYKVGGVHQHTPEIVQNLSAAVNGAVAATGVSSGAVTVSFTPLLVPMPRGILATCTARTNASAEQLRQALHDAYDSEPFVQVLAPGRWPSSAATLGSNSVHLQVAVDELSGRATVVAAEDNLIKGAAGQAIQNANLVLGLPETAGLTSQGIAP